MPSFSRSVIDSRAALRVACVWRGNGRRREASGYGESSSLDHRLERRIRRTDSSTRLAEMAPSYEFHKLIGS